MANAFETFTNNERNLQSVSAVPKTAPTFAAAKTTPVRVVAKAYTPVSAQKTYRLSNTNVIKTAIQPLASRSSQSFNNMDVSKISTSINSAIELSKQFNDTPAYNELLKAQASIENALNSSGSAQQSAFASAQSQLRSALTVLNKSASQVNENMKNVQRTTNSSHAINSTPVSRTLVATRNANYHEGKMARSLAPAPVVNTPAPVVNTPAPVINTPAPVINTPAPVVNTTPVNNTTTTTPVVKTTTTYVPPYVAPTTTRFAR